MSYVLRPRFVATKRRAKTRHCENQFGVTATSHHITSRHVMSRHISPHHVTPRHVTSRRSHQHHMCRIHSDVARSATQRFCVQRQFLFSCDWFPTSVQFIVQKHIVCALQAHVKVILSSAISMNTSHAFLACRVSFGLSPAQYTSVSLSSLLFGRTQSSTIAGTAQAVRMVSRPCPVVLVFSHTHTHYLALPEHEVVGAHARTHTRTHTHVYTHARTYT